MPADALIALVVIGLLGLVFWVLIVLARGGSPYDDGAGEPFIPYRPEPDPDDEPDPPATRR